MSKPVSETPHRLVASRAALSAARLRELPGIIEVEERDAEWCLTVEPGRIDRGHLSGNRLPAGPVEQGREKLSDAGLALVLAVLAAAARGTPWAAWVGGSAALLTLVLPARRVFEAVLVSAPGGQRLRDRRRALGLLALVAAGALDGGLLAYVPLAFGALLGAEGALVLATAPRWRLRWAGKDVSWSATGLQHNDLVVLPPNVPCPALCRVEDGSASIHSVQQDTPQTVTLGGQVPLGGRGDGVLVLRVLAVPEERKQACTERPTASLRLDQSLQALDVGMLVFGSGLVVTAGWTGTALSASLLAAGLAWLVPLGVLHQTGAGLVQRTIERFWEAGLHLTDAASLDAWGQLQGIVLLPSSLEQRGWDALAFFPEPRLPAWPRVRVAMETGSSADPSVQVVPGQGLTARLGGDTWIVGSPLFAGTEQAPPLQPAEPPPGAPLVVVHNGTVIATGTGHRDLRAAAQSDLAALRTVDLPLRLLADPQDGQRLCQRMGRTALTTAHCSGPPPAWQVPPWRAAKTLWVSASWPEGAPTGPAVRLGGGGEGVLAIGGLAGIPPALKEARSLRLSLRILTLAGPSLVAGTLAAGLWPAATLPMLLGTWLGLGLILGGVLSLPLQDASRALPHR